MFKHSSTVDANYYLPEQRTLECLSEAKPGG